MSLLELHFQGLTCREFARTLTGFIRHRVIAGHLVSVASFCLDFIVGIPAGESLTFVIHIQVTFIIKVPLGPEKD